MKYLNKSEIGYLQPRAKWLRLGLIIMLIGLLGISSFSCKKCDDTSNQEQYYVRYEVNSSTIYIGGNLNVTIKTENNAKNTITVAQRTKWETIIGPVEKGFNATLNVVAQGETYDKLSLNAAIYVSKNDSPFALKEIDDSISKRDSLQINYIID